MKKFLIAAVVMITAVTVRAQEDNVPVMSEEECVQWSQDFDLAQGLAEYGYNKESVSALLEAAEILIDLGIVEANPDASADIDIYAQKVFNDAKSLLGKDKTFAAWIKKIDKSMSGTRGSLVGYGRMQQARPLQRNTSSGRYNGGRY